MKKSFFLLGAVLFLLSCTTSLPPYDFLTEIPPNSGFIAFSTNDNRDTRISIQVQDTSGKAFFFALTPFLFHNNSLSPVLKEKSLYKDKYGESAFYYLYPIPPGSYQTSSFTYKPASSFDSKFDILPLNSKSFKVEPNSITYLGSYYIKTGGFPFMIPSFQTVDNFFDFQIYLSANGEKFKNLRVVESMTELKVQPTILNPN